MNASIRDVKALTFDVFGTVADWRTSIIRAGESLGREKGLDIDWTEFADRWRGGYAPAMDRVRRGDLPWTNIDGLHRMILDDLLEEFGGAGLSEQDRDDFNRAWHRLDPWPDVVAGLTRMRKRYVVASLSNGNVALLTNMARHGGYAWDCVLSSELARHYKPDPEVYRTAAELLGLPPRAVMMVAAHRHDLLGAQAVGFRTAFVLRPDEFGPHRRPDLAPEPSFDVVASDFLDLASKLGA